MVSHHVDTVFEFSSVFYSFVCLFVCIQDLNKRLSLPADIRIPDGYLEKMQLSSPPFDQPLSRRSRRASLVRHEKRGKEGKMLESKKEKG